MHAKAKLRKRTSSVQAAVEGLAVQLRVQRRDVFLPSKSKRMAVSASSGRSESPVRTT